MSYTYNIDPKAMFEDRSKQFVSFGIPKAVMIACNAFTSALRIVPNNSFHSAFPKPM